jgi:site-specific recombinase XerD
MADKDIAFLTFYLQAETVPNQKTPKRKVMGLSKMAVNALLTAPNQRTVRGFRDHTLMLTLYSTATRINELLSLKIGNIFTDGPKPRIIVIGKGRKKRPIPLLAKPVQYIKQYLAEYHPDSDNPDALLFCSKSKGIYAPMSAENVNKLLKRYAAIANKNCKDVPLDLHAHQFRHAKASHWLENGMNIAQISYLLGHESIHTTMIYLDITTEQESKALETLEDENQKMLPKKWKNIEHGNLEEFLGLR